MEPVYIPLEVLISGVRHTVRINPIPEPPDRPVDHTGAMRRTYRRMMDEIMGRSVVNKNGKTGELE